MIALFDMFVCAFILWQSLISLNQMHHRTHHGLRFAFILMAVCALGYLLSIPFGYFNPTVLDFGLDFSVAALLWKKQESLVWIKQ